MNAEVTQWIATEDPELRTNIISLLKHQGIDPTTGTPRNLYRNLCYDLCVLAVHTLKFATRIPYLQVGRG